ncbi:MAG: hypothetical protein ACM336_00045 [Acidobacteriota bacterium]
MRLKIADIRTDGGTQPRASLDFELTSQAVQPAPLVAAQAPPPPSTAATPVLEFPPPDKVPAKQRMIDTLSNIHSLCLDLSGLNVHVIASQCTPEELRKWRLDASQSAKQLRLFVDELVAAAGVARSPEGAA